MTRSFFASWAAFKELLKSRCSSARARSGQALPKILDCTIVFTISAFAQLLTTAIEVGLKKVNCQFPATVLAMFVVFLSLLALGFKWKGLEAFYTRYLASAVSPAPWLAALDS